MISLILPYWDRQSAADRALAALAEHYADLDLEVIVVDDGNRVPFLAPVDFPLDLRVLRLPEKAQPTPQSRAWNAGVRASRGEVIALSCIEVLHTEPVLAQMAESLDSIGHDGYVLAAAWCPERREWHCHGSAPWPGFPHGTGPAFLGMLNRELFCRVGGFDEDYMEGAGYEDRDFVRRLMAADAIFCLRNDLVVLHPKTGASIKWPAEAFARNKMIFEEKWIN